MICFPSNRLHYSIVAYSVVGISDYQDREIVLLVQKYGMLCRICEICIL